MRRMLGLVMVASVAGLASENQAEAVQRNPRNAAQLADAFVIIETNCTDGDSGIQMFIDGEGWDRLRIFGPRNRFLGFMTARGGLGRVGLTELFFEGEEPELVYPPELDKRTLLVEGLKAGPAPHPQASPAPCRV